MSIKQKLRIMVVDDMSTSRGIITQALDEIGIVNNSAESDARSAISKIAANPVHLVISDYNMPNLDGLQFLECLRKNSSTKGIGFILVTGSPNSKIIAEGKRLGMNNLLRKPFSVGQLQSCIEQVVGKL